jgi:nitrite reductase (NADH) large subunit
VTVFGDETHPNYNRIQLSAVLAGEKNVDEITLNPLAWYISNDITLRLGIRITGIDTKKKTVTGDDGSVTRWDKLLIATGSSAFLPPIAGLDKERVCPFRTLEDMRSLLAWAAPGKKAVVIGGGLLGLEAARGLQL